MTILLVLLLAILILLLVIYLFFAGWAIFDLTLAAPFVPTKAEAVRKMIELGEIIKGDQVFDLGSGDGRLVIAAAKAGANAVGIEKNPFLFFLSRLKAKFISVKVTFILGDIFNQNLTYASVIFVYLTPKLLAKLVPKLERELRPGTKVISNRYQIPTWKFVDNFDSIYLYKIGKF